MPLPRLPLDALDQLSRQFACRIDAFYPWCTFALALRASPADVRVWAQRHMRVLSLDCTAEHELARTSDDVSRRAVRLFHALNNSQSGWFRASVQIPFVLYERLAHVGDRLVVAHTFFRDGTWSFPYWNIHDESDDSPPPNRVCNHYWRDSERRASDVEDRYKLFAVSGPAPRTRHALYSTAQRDTWTPALRREIHWQWDGGGDYSTLDTDGVWLRATLEPLMEILFCACHARGFDTDGYAFTLMLSFCVTQEACRPLCDMELQRVAPIKRAARNRPR